jgi:flagellar protein FliS
MFTANSRAALNAYRKAGVECVVDSASPHQLVLMLFEGAQIAIAKARLHMQFGEIAAKGEAILKAVCIIDQGLKASLDTRQGGELAVRLQALYDYMVSRITHANLHNDPQPLDEVARLLGELEQAWRQIGHAKAAPPPTKEPQARATALVYSKV